MEWNGHFCLRGLVAAVLAGAVGLAALPAPAQEAGGFSDAAVARAIARGVKFLRSTQRGDGSWETTGTHNNDWYTVGPTAICAYALLESGVRPTDGNMARALKYLEQTYTEMTYCLAFRSLAFASAMKSEPKYRDLLRKDVRALLLSMDRAGGYTYFSRGQIPARSDYSGFCGGEADQSNSQYGLLGVWAGALQGEEIPRKYWDLSLKFWLKRQFPNGGWGYSPKGRNEPYMAMTLAGLASVYVCTDNLYASRFLGCRANPGFPAARRALKYVDENFESIRRQGGWYYYTLYGIERVALATGRKYLGKNDWYRDGAGELIARQAGDGSWTRGAGTQAGGRSSSTSYALLFLLRGRRPVLFNRLEYEGDWNNRPRALANLTRWLSRQFEHEVHWQVINLQTPVEEWHDAPLLCITGSKAPSFTDEQLDKLRRFAWQGGTIFSITECGGPGFRDAIREVYKKLFPTRKLTLLPAGHEIYQTYFRLPARPALYEISNGARPLAIHSDVDLPRAWQAGQYRTALPSYRTAVNVVAYTNDKAALAGELRARGTSPWPEPYKGAARLTVRLARLRHGGNWNPEPLAYERFARLMGLRQRIAVEVLGPMGISELAGSGAKLAVMTGTGELALSEAESKALKDWLQAGGTLVLDAAGGNEQFVASAEKLLTEMFGRRAVRTLAGTTGVYAVKGFEIDRVAYRRSMRKALGDPAPRRLRAVLLDGRPAVYFSRDDITCGLVGNPSYAIRGYEPKTAFALLRNVVLATSGAAVEPHRAAQMTAAASRQSDQAAKAVDGDPASRWDTGGPMKKGDWFTIDLGRIVAIKKIVLDTRGSPENHPKGYKMYVSPDGKNWGQSVVEGKAGAALTGVRFPAAPRLRHLKFELTEGDESRSWSIHEVQVETE